MGEGNCIFKQLQLTEKYHKLDDFEKPGLRYIESQNHLFAIGESDHSI